LGSIKYKCIFLQFKKKLILCVLVSVLGKFTVALQYRRFCLVLKPTLLYKELPCKQTETPSQTASFHHLVLITGIVKIFVAGRVLCKGLRLKKQSPGSCLVQAGLSHLSNQAAPSGTLITLAPGAVSCAVVQRREAPYLSITAYSRAFTNLI